eukprot:scaffold229_cov155-Ochromonas_danica.AAC.4
MADIASKSEKSGIAIIGRGLFSLWWKWWNEQEHRPDNLDFHFGLSLKVWCQGNEKKMESPHQRLQRLRSELKELSDDLNSFVENDPSSLWSSLQHEAGKLLAEADGLRSHRAWQYHPSSKLQEVLSSTTSSNAATDAPGHSLSDLMKSNLSSLELERRIHRLETLLGQQSNNFDCYSSSSSSTGNPSHCKDLFPVMETLSNLERKLSLLDPQTIESIRAKTNLLKWELESLAGKKKDGAVAVGAQEAKGLEVMRKVEDLVGQVGKVRAIADDLPALVLRLKTLETTHWAAASAQARLVQLEKDVRTALGTASENCKLLNSMKEGLEENMRTVENNLRKLEQRS